MIQFALKLNKNKDLLIKDLKWSRIDLEYLIVATLVDPYFGGRPGSRINVTWARGNV